MTVATMTLTDFLLARVAEDERVAVRYHQLLCQRIQYDPDVPPGQCTCAHPRRIAAECEAKRRIVEYRQGFEHPETPADEVLFPALGVPLDRVLKVLAVAYADHPDYREEWRA